LPSIGKLKRKYGETIAEVLAFYDEVRRQIAAVESAGERMDALRKEQKRMAAEYEKTARELSEARRAAARKHAPGTSHRRRDRRAGSGSRLHDRRGNRSHDTPCPCRLARAWR
jgi:hypothetical protein